MPLTDTSIKNAKPRAKKYKMFDGDGLFLEVQPTGAKYWRMKSSGGVAQGSDDRSR
jgi:Arm DNA-binding domain